MDNKNQNPAPLQKGQDKDTNFKASIQVSETVVKTENIVPQRIVFDARLVHIYDHDGTVRKTKDGERYIVNIENGVISFDKPLKFRNNG